MLTSSVLKTLTRLKCQWLFFHLQLDVLCKYFLSSLCIFIGLWARITWVRLQPEELTLLLIQLRRHQAEMAGVHSPSDAFAHLQHHQHNGLLGPSMQVRDPRTSATSASALWSRLPPADPSHSLTVIHRIVRYVAKALLSPSFNPFGMRIIAFFRV